MRNNLKFALFSLVFGVLSGLLAPWSVSQSDAAEADRLARAGKLQSLALVDVNDKTHEPFAEESTKAIALLFVSTDCPIANSFQPTIQKIYADYADTGIKFFMVHCSTMTSLEEIKKHVEANEIKMPVVFDDKQELGRLVEAKSTPEAIVIDPKGAIRYRGLINNMYAKNGLMQEVTDSYLADAFDALIAGESIATATTKPFGCTIYYARVRGRR